jgi:hypothetical protein
MVMETTAYPTTIPKSPSLLDDRTTRGWSEPRNSRILVHTRQSVFALARATACLREMLPPVCNGRTPIAALNGVPYTAPPIAHNAPAMNSLIWGVIAGRPPAGREHA